MNRTEFEKAFPFPAGCVYVKEGDSYYFISRSHCIDKDLNEYNKMFIAYNSRQSEIPSLQEENERLIGALKEIADYGGCITGEDGQDMMSLAKEALTKEEPDNE